MFVGDKHTLTNSVKVTTKPMENHTIEEIRAIEDNFVDSNEHIDTAALIDWKRITNG